MTRIPPNPCYKCERRYPGCSAKCQDSKDWHEAFYRRKAQIKVERGADRIIKLQQFFHKER